jgi:hypothetical protein
LLLAYCSVTVWLRPLTDSACRSFESKAGSSFCSKAYQCAKLHCRSRAAVVIEPVSADNLCKTGISAVRPETFADFVPGIGRSGAWR